MSLGTRRSVLGVTLMTAWMLWGSCSPGGGGNDSAPPSNRPPVISSLSALPTTVLPEHSTLLAASASDPDGDAVIFSWSATAGTFAGTGASVTWTAPSSPGLYPVTVTASDGRSSDQATVHIGVLTASSWLSGRYFVAGFEHDFVDSHHVSFTGTLTFDGVGAYAGDLTTNGDGAIEPQYPAGAYAVTEGGEIAIDDGGGGTLAGGIDAAHQVAVASRITSSRNPMAVIAIKQSGFYSRSSLSGDYHVAAFHWDWGYTPAYAALAGFGSFNSGSGTFALTATNNWGGVISPVTAAWNYSVGSDGSLVINDPAEPADALRGGVMAGGDVFVAASVGAGAKPIVLVGIRKSGVLDATSLSGPHWTITLGAAGAGASSWTGQRSFDGVSSWSAGGISNDNGTVTTDSSSGDYSITSEGRMTMTDLPTVVELGVRNGGTAAAGAVITSGQPPRFVFSVRK